MKRLHLSIVDLFIHENCLDLLHSSYLDAAKFMNIQVEFKAVALVEPDNFLSVVVFFKLLEHIATWSVDYRSIRRVGSMLSRKDPRFKNMRLNYQWVFVLSENHVSYYVNLEQIFLKFFIVWFSKFDPNFPQRRSFKVIDYQQILLKLNKPFTRSLYFDVIYAETVKEFRLNLLAAENSVLEKFLVYFRK